MRPQFVLPKMNRAMKELDIGGLGAVSLIVDYDEVDHSEVDALLPLVVEALNGIALWRIEAALRRVGE